MVNTRVAGPAVSGDKGDAGLGPGPQVGSRARGGASSGLTSPSVGTRLQAEAVRPRPSPDALEWAELGPTGDDYDQEEVVAARSGSLPHRPGARALTSLLLPRLCHRPVQPAPGSRLPGARPSPESSSPEGRCGHDTDLVTWPRIRGGRSSALCRGEKATAARDWEAGLGATGTGRTEPQGGRPAVTGPSAASPSHADSRYWRVCDDIILLQLRERDAFRWSTGHL